VRKLERDKGEGIKEGCPIIFTKLIEKDDDKGIKES